MVPRNERIKAERLRFKKIRQERRLRQTKKTTTLVGTSLLLSTAILPNLITGKASANAGNYISNTTVSSEQEGANMTLPSENSTSQTSTPKISSENGQVPSTNNQGTQNSSESIQPASASQSKASSASFNTAGTNYSSKKIVEINPNSNSSNSQNYQQSQQPRTPQVDSTANIPVQITANSEQVKAFVKAIGEDARTLASQNDLYASVMIAQAALESGFGTSGLSIAPNYNLFGIKGSYNGASVNMATNEDDGSGNQYGINATFRRYPSYKESLSDYVHVIKTTNLGNGAYYSGAWKSHANSYKDATAYLQGRYATSTQYSELLNKIIETYHLTDYDNATASTKYVVKSGDCLWAIAQANNTTVEDLKAANGLHTDLILVGQQLQLS